MRTLARIVSARPMLKLARVLNAAAGIAFGCAAYLYLTLPDVRTLRATNPSTTAFIELRAREAHKKGEEPRRVQRWVSYARISPHLKRAVLVAEDSSFWQHDGVDYAQLKEAMEVNAERGEFVRGASTITQQLAKNLYLSPSKSPVRKVRELVIARRLEAELSKQRILELYLNLIEWGDGIYGAEAAARTYFRKSAAELGPQEAALLAAAIINPRVLTPAHPTARLRRRQQMIMVRMGAVTPPPVVTDPAAPVSGETQPPEEEPAIPTVPEEGLPPVLPGQPIPPPPPPVKPCAVPPCR
jgi:monofunctional biosynthetic peptidoglycan transglycosylase